MITISLKVICTKNYRHFLRIFVSCWVCTCFKMVFGSEKTVLGNVDQQYLHDKIVNTYFQNRKNMTTSNLGTILFKNIDPQIFANRHRQAQTFVVVLWMVWTEVVATYLRTTNFDTQSVTQEILRNCRVKNCIYYSSYSTDIESADAIIFSTEKHAVPVYPSRDPRQRWILWNQGSPIHKTTKWSDHGIKSLSRYFNWTMGYRSDSDIPVPYGRTIPLPAPIEVNLEYLGDALGQLIPYWHNKQTDILAMALVTDCKWKYTPLTELVKIDIYWKSCPKDRNTDCTLPEKYLFFLAFEEASCLQYISESVFHHAYSKGAIPIIKGPSVEDCEKLLPPNSFLHVNYYNDVADLAKHMKEIAGDYVNLLTYHTWRQHFAVENENGFFNTTSYQLCRVCEALNFNDGERKTYDSDELHLFYNEKLFCNLTYKCGDPV